MAKNKKKPDIRGEADLKDPVFWLMCSEAECRALSAGQVPERVQEMSRMAWDWNLETVGDNYEDRVMNQRRGA